MESAIVKNLRPDFEPVSVVWSNTIPDDALQFKKGKFGCILYLFAEAARRGKVAGGNRDTISCNGGRAALGLGVDKVQLVIRSQLSPMHRLISMLPGLSWACWAWMAGRSCKSGFAMTP